MPGMATVFPSKVLIFKAILRNDARLFALAEHAANLECVTEMVRYHFDIEEGECFNVYYVNSFGNMLGLWSEEDFADACSHARVKSDLERQLVLVVDRADPTPEMELAALARITRRMERLEVDLINSMNEVNSILDDGGNLLPPALQLPRWVAREELYYETVRGDPPSAQSDVEETLLESVLLPSPRVTVNTLVSNSEQSHSTHLANLADLAEVVYEEDFEPYTDDDEIPDDGADNPPTPRALFTQLISPAKEVKFGVPFPAFVPFPPSPTPSSHVFSLTEATPFPFPVLTAASICTCRCTCTQRATATAAAQVSGTDDVVSNSLCEHTEKRSFQFVVSVGTQYAALPSPLPSPLPVSEVRSVSIGTQTEAAVCKSVTAACSIGAQTEETSFTSLASPLASSVASSTTTEEVEAAVISDTVASENEDADYEML